MDFIVFITEQWILVSALLTLGIVYLWLERLKGGKGVSIHEMTRLLNTGEAVLVDVRDNKEFTAGHVVDAINIPHGSIAERAVELDKHKDKIIILADKLGQHAGHVGQILSKRGMEVRRLNGGMSEWSAQNLPLVSIKNDKSKSKKKSKKSA